MMCITLVIKFFIGHLDGLIAVVAVWEHYLSKLVSATVEM